MGGVKGEGGFILCSRAGDIKPYLLLRATLALFCRRRKSGETRRVLKARRGALPTIGKGKKI
jgi:hypothetical protein